MKCLDVFQFWLKSVENNGYLTRRLTLISACTYRIKGTLDLDKSHTPDSVLSGRALPAFQAVS
jgi:hypothetical protein